MGNLTEYFIARSDPDATRVHSSPTGPKRAGFKTAEWKNVEWIRSGPPDNMIAGSDKDEHWVFRIHDHHLALLAGIADGEVATTAERWAAAQASGIWPSAAETRELLVDPIGVAREARATGQYLYCWVSL